MVNIAVVDDDEKCAALIKQNIIKYMNHEGIDKNVEAFGSSKQLLFALGGNKRYQIYFLDIELPDMDGLSLAEKIAKKNIESYIVFITSHFEVVLEAFKVRAFRFIPKEMLEERIPEALGAVLKELSLQTEEYYIINTELRFEKIFYRDIIYIFRDGKNAVFVTKSGSKHERKSLRQVYANLSPNDFVFIEKGYIINILHVVGLMGNVLEMEDRISLKVSQSRLKEVKEKIHTFWRYNK